MHFHLQTKKMRFFSLPSSIVAVIPCYNVARFCEPIVLESSVICRHVIVIDDGSTDDTGAILQKLGSKYPQKIHVITFQKNRGKGFGLLEGFKYALEHYQFDALVTMDGDGQHLPHFIEGLTKPIFQGADFVIGSRPFKEMPLRSRWGNRSISFLLQCVYPHSPRDTQSGMRAFTPSVVPDLIDVPGGKYQMEFSCLLLALKKGWKIVEVPIPSIYLEKNKSSHFSPLKDSFKILKVLILHWLGYS